MEECNIHFSPKGVLLSKSNGRVISQNKVMLSLIIKRGKKLLQSEAGFVVMKWRNYYYKIKQQNGKILVQSVAGVTK